MEMRSDRAFETAALCRKELPSVIRRMNHAGKTVSGRCAPAVDQPAGIDPTVTGSTEPGADDPDLATVRVTRIIDGRAITDEYVGSEGIATQGIDRMGGWRNAHAPADAHSRLGQTGSFWPPARKSTTRHL